MDSMVHNRLYNLAETRAWLCSEQAGFRKLRSCEDQILRITQTNSDGFQAAKPQGSLMALLDFSKAFDRVWKEELLLAASSKGIPIPCARWLHDFLSNRAARVQINGERGDSVPLDKGPHKVRTIPTDVSLIHRRSALRCARDGEDGTLRRLCFHHQKSP